MSYSGIDEENTNRMLLLVKFLIDEVLSAGGDGDAIWHSKYFDTKDIHRVIMTKISTSPDIMPDHWSVQLMDKSILIGGDQEWLFITNSKETFDQRPSWTQCAIQW